MNSIYKKGINRDQQLLLPPSLNDYVGEENAVRAIDAYAESIDTHALGFRTKKNQHHRRTTSISSKASIKNLPLRLFK